MTNLSDFRAKAKAEFPGTPIEFDDGSKVEIRSILDLSDADEKRFNDNVQKIQALDETAEVADLRRLLTDTLADISDDPTVARAGLSGEPVGVLMMILKEVTSNGDDASKSKAGTPATSRRGSAKR